MQLAKTENAKITVTSMKLKNHSTKTVTQYNYGCL